ncbi:FAD:protein FMN transferase [Acidobacteriota bacterium]
MTPLLVKKNWFFIFVFLYLLSACVPAEKWNTFTVVYFDTVCEIKIFSSSIQFKSAKEEVHHIFSEIETLFSPGAENYSSQEVIQLFQRGLAVHYHSAGDFDLSVSPLSELWGFSDRSYRIPSTEEIQHLLRKIGMTKIKQEEKRLILPSGMKLDWGGIAKGYGIDRAAQSLKTIGIARGFINAGGDLFCWGTNPDNQPWQIGIKHPRAEGFTGVLSLTNIGTATTGDYQRYFTREGIRYHHIFNPHTGFPAAGKQSVTVIGPETTICDALATALFVSSHPETILTHYADYGAIIIDDGGRLVQLGREYSFQPVQ